MQAHTQQSTALQIDILARQGVAVAAGQGSHWQKVFVHGTQCALLVTALLLVVNSPRSLLVLPVVCLGIDFLSGFVHWFFETRVRPGPTRLGRIAVDFLDHHVRPQRTLEVGFVVSAWRPALFVTWPIFSMTLLLPGGPGAHPALFWIALLSLYIPQAHKFAHAPSRPLMIRWLQNSRLILSPAAHRQHHKNTNTAFCVFTGWLNPLLDTIGFWRCLGRLFDAARLPARRERTN